MNKDLKNTKTEKMKTNFKKEEKQLKQLLGSDYKHIEIDLIQISKVKDEYHEVGDIVSKNQHFLHYMIEILAKPKEMIGNIQFGGGIIDGWEIPFKDYEMKMSGWICDDNEPINFDASSAVIWKKIEKQISEILGLKIYKMKNTLTQKQRLNKYQKSIDKSIVDDNGRLRHWFVCQLDDFMNMVDLPIDEVDDKDWSNWENGDCELVNEMVVKSVLEKYLETL